ncbi:hypothetical protein [Scytonema tolypothrichoides]|uniref:hypothetical protein n=1 Tax=Scytonema tolypothrichoides TaxID=1233230 RepID=UPI000AD33B5E
MKLRLQGTFVAEFFSYKLYLKPCCFSKSFAHLALASDKGGAGSLVSVKGAKVSDFR